MTKTDYLNYASDLRRIANWAGRGDREKLPLIERLLDSAYGNPEVKKVISHFRVDMNPKELFDNRQKRLFFAEQVLISSSRLEHLPSTESSGKKWCHKIYLIYHSWVVDNYNSLCYSAEDNPKRKLV